MFGEIDCREGLLLAVDKLKYDNIQEAMGVLADIYMEVLTRTVRERNLCVFVHPVPPVLNETRHIVTPFNDLLRERVRSRRLFCFSMQGTHASTDYLRHFEHCPSVINNQASQIKVGDLLVQVKETEPHVDRLHWLDVGDQYLCENRAKLKPELSFDGTHMAPVFLKYVNAAVESALRTSV